MKQISAIQEPIWLTQQLHPESSLYNVGGYAFIQGELREEILIKSIKQVLENTDAISSAYYAFNEIALEQNTLFKKYDIAILDFSDEKHSTQTCLHWMDRDIKRTFETSKNLLKVRLLKDSSKRYYWYVKVHHLIFDGYAMSLFFNTVSTLYSAYTNHTKEKINDKSYTYTDFIEDEKTYKLSNEYIADKKFWIDRLKNSSNEKSFQSCLQSNYTESLIAKRKAITINRDAYNQIEKFCKIHNCTTFHYFVSALFIINKLYNNESSVIGLPVFNRRNYAFKNTLGTFVNMLPFAVACTEDITFIHLLLTVKNELKQCYRHQRLPLYDVLKELDRGGSMYNLSFSYQKNTYQPSLGNATASIHYLHSGQQQDNLAFSLLEYANTKDLTLTIDYKENAFTEQVINQLINHYDTLINSLYKTPDKPIDQINYISASEQHELLFTFNDTAADYPTDKTLTQLFEKQAAKTPNNIAVIFQEKTYSYSNLNQHANRLAHYLQSKYNIQPNDLIGIKLEKSEWMIISILGALKSGGAYLPIDPSYPQERINYIIEDSTCKLVIDEKEIEKFKQEANNYTDNTPPNINTPTDLAYVIYTSGSTGQPKGCMLEHRGVINRIQWMHQHYNFNTADIILQKTNFTFDVSVWEIFMPLCWGVKMVLCQKEDIGSPERILTLIHQHKITCLHFVPSMLNAFITNIFNDDKNIQALSSVTKLITSGEALSIETVKKWYAKTNIPIHNLYGPTEASIDVTHYTTSQEDTIIPIGRPIWNTQLYIIDKHHHLLPIGAVGEICISGDGLARGYLNKAELTKEKFVDNPFKPGSKMYKTGDIGRWLADGNIEYIGRKDEQVKIRGYRIELGEIETALQKHVNITTAVVIAKENQQQEKELVAYIVSKQALNTTEIRNYLSNSLPLYMLPSHYVQLDALPLNANGKLDKKALPNPETLGLSSGVAYIAPRNKTEEQLVEIWKEILGKEKIGIHDNFFELGGHSLKLTRLSTQLHKIFNAHIDLKDLFTTPTIAQQAQLVQQSHKTAYNIIAKAPAQRSYPLSSAQQRLWILSQFEESSKAYNMPGVYVFEGDLDKAALENAFNTLIERHEILRTVFKQDEQAEIQQYIQTSEAVNFTIQYIDANKKQLGYPAIQNLVQKEIEKPFDLSTGPLLRASLYKIAHHQWIFVYVMHHIISDGWSMSVLIKEILHFYKYYTNQTTHLLQPLSIQYKDYAVWQQQQLHSESLQTDKNYWLQQLQGDIPVLEMPTDKPRPAVKTYNGNVVQQTIHPSLTKKIKALSQQEGATLFMSLLTAVNTLLYRYTGQEDIIIGSPIAGRTHADLDDQIGLYINTLALRTQFNGTHSYKALLEIIKHNTVNAYKHQAYPFDALVDALNLQKDMSRNALFDVMVVLQNNEAGSDTLITQKLGDVTISHYDGVMQTASQFDITFTFVEIEETIQVQIEYNTDLYHKETISRLGKHLNILLEAIVQAPDTAINQINYISEAEKHELLVTFNNTKVDYPNNKTVIDLFEEQVHKTPNNIAVVCEDISLTYKQLNEQSNCLAHYLRSNYTIKPDDLIGIQLERSEWMIIAMLGILKSGGAYVPIDPTYPKERIDYMIEDSKCKLVIDEKELATLEVGKEKYSTKSISLIHHKNNLAYVLYTSGTTGNPKGVMIEHCAVTDYTMTASLMFKMQDQDRVIQQSSISFDTHVEEIYPTLINGATLLISKNGGRDIQELKILIQEKNATILSTTPLVIQELNTTHTSLHSLRLLISGGDIFNTSYISNYIGKLTIYDGYGPTECTVCSTFLNIENEYLHANIGRPINNKNIYILSHHNQLQPVGVIGEICIGGAGLARGYLNNPTLTKEKFIPHPFKQNERLYTTGDLGKWLPDGTIEFIGRKDTQVKIRGYRIELGEIETALRNYANVDAAVVIAKSNIQGEKELIAYMVSKQPLNVANVRAHLSQTLPIYMLPHYVVQLDVLPLTPNGKVDRKKLIDRETLALSSRVEYVAPRNETEKKLVQIWQEILGKEQIGINDNFFALGGHSLRATRLAGQIYKQFEVKIPLQQLFIQSVLKDQAACISQAKKTAYIYIQPASQQAYYPLSSAQKRLFFLQEFAPDSTGYNMPMVSYLGKTVDKKQIAIALQQLVNRHESFRTSFIKIDGTAYQQIHSEIVFTLDEQKCTSEEFEKYVHTFIKPFDLTQAPLLRSAIVQVKNVGYVWMVDMHHIIADGTSQEVLIDDFIHLYKGKQLVPLTLQYKDFSEWQNTMINNGELDHQKKYWLTQLSQDIPQLNFPADRSRPSTFSFEGAVYRFTIDKALTHQLIHFGNQHQASLQITLLSVLHILLHKYTGQEDLIIGCGIAGRRHPDVERIVGMFVNSLAMRNFPQAHKSFQEFYTEVIETSIQAYENQDVQFEDLVDMLKVERDPSRNPVFDIALVVQNFEQSKTHFIQSIIDDDHETPDFINTIYNQTFNTSKFDMTWFVHQKDDHLFIEVEYYAAIYNETTIERVTNHFKKILQTILENPNIVLSDINMLTYEEEQKLLRHYVHGKIQPYPSNTNIHQLFRAKSVHTPEHAAVIDETGSYTYKILEERSNQLSKFLCEDVQLPIEARVGILQTRSKELIVSILGVLKAGGAYVPLDSAYPEDRLLYMIEDAAIEIVLVDKSLVEFANRLQWRSNKLKHLVCVDSDDIYREQGGFRNQLMLKDLWDHVGETATDAISGGGWMSSYTGEYLTETEMREYSENTYLKLKDHLHTNMKVLEIGCSSGLTMLQIAPKVGMYYGTDLSSSILVNTEKLVKEKGCNNIILSCLPAHEIDQLNEKDFDLVIINSVIQSFNGHNYLRDVLIKLIDKIKEEGILFIGDIMDEDKRTALIEDLTTFKKENAEKGYRTKTDWASELFISKDYFNDVIADNIGITEAQYSDKIHTVPNELTRYRYDAFLRINKRLSRLKLEKKKYQYDVQKINKYDTTPLDLNVKPSNLAYIIYTSGSTGKPKGVMIEHQSLIHYIYWAIDTYVQKELQENFGLFSSLSFDLTVTSIYAPLLSGNTINVYSPSLDVTDVLKCYVQSNNEKEIIKLTPSHINLIGTMELQASQFKKAIVGGEALRSNHIHILKQLNSDVRIYNEYGPTEATVGCMLWEVPHQYSNILIGKPIANTAIYILDDNNQLVPEGVIGEICISGDGLARGYLNKIELTKKTFVPNPYQQGERMYKTGDLGRWVQDGNVEYIGRKDDQVKIRGYRIELGEIEKHLLAIQEIKEAVVITKELTKGEKELVAYMVCNHPIHTTEIRDHLRQTLPEYMIPSHYVTLSALPLTTNGKVNKKALPTPEALTTRVGVEYVAPENEVQQALANIWGEVLHIDQVGIKDNFFDLGGHSLKVVLLVFRIEKEFDIKLKIKDVFANPTIEALSNVIKAKHWIENSKNIEAENLNTIEI